MIGGRAVFAGWKAAELEIRMTRITAGLAVGLLLMGAGAPAAFASPVGQTCAVELQQLCPAAKGAALHQCRAAHRGNFSASCQQALAASGMKLKDVKPETR
jgi:hypothetical protein